MGRTCSALCLFFYVFELPKSLHHCYQHFCCDWQGLSNSSTRVNTKYCELIIAFGSSVSRYWTGPVDTWCRPTYHHHGTMFGHKNRAVALLLLFLASSCFCQEDTYSKEVYTVAPFRRVHSCAPFAVALSPISANETGAIFTSHISRNDGCEYLKSLMCCHVSA